MPAVFDKEKLFVLFYRTSQIRPVPQLNYHHLRYFRVIAQERNLTRAARLLNVSASALSTQLRTLESQLGRPLFDRTQKSLQLTEAGILALQYAETIFRAGDELLDTFGGKPNQRSSVLRIGAMATLSRNFQLDFIRPAFASHNVEVVLRSGDLPELLDLLERYEIDILLSTGPVRRDGHRRIASHLIAEYPVSLVAAPQLKIPTGRFPANLRHLPLVLPSPQSGMREAFDAMLAAAGVQPLVAAEVDDMAMLRLLAREGVGATLVPPVVVKDELLEGRVREIWRVPGLNKPFFAITLQRQFPNPWVNQLLRQSGVSPRKASTRN